jgi:hypothetical protein
MQQGRNEDAVRVNASSETGVTAGETATSRKSDVWCYLHANERENSAGQYAVSVASANS